MITEQLMREVKEYTDAGRWKHSWHWERDEWGRVTLDGVRQMLRDLNCDGSEGKEMLDTLLHIRRRYKLAAELRAAIEAEEKAMQDEAVILAEDEPK